MASLLRVLRKPLGRFHRMQVPLQLHRAAWGRGQHAAAAATGMHMLSWYQLQLVKVQGTVTATGSLNFLDPSKLRDNTGVQCCHASEIYWSLLLWSTRVCLDNYIDPVFANAFAGDTQVTTLYHLYYCHIKECLCSCIMETAAAINPRWNGLLPDSIQGLLNSPLLTVIEVIWISSATDTAPEVYTVLPPQPTEKKPGQLEQWQVWGQWSIHYLKKSLKVANTLLLVHPTCKLVIQNDVWVVSVDTWTDFDIHNNYDYPSAHMYS